MECQGPRLTPETASVLAEGQSFRLLRLALRLGAVAEAAGPGRESRFTVPEQCTEGRTGLVRMEPARLCRLRGQRGEEAGHGGTQSSPGDGGGWPSGDGHWGQSTASGDGAGSAGPDASRGRPRRLQSERSFWRNGQSPVNSVFQESKEFVYEVAEETRSKVFGVVTPGYDIIARLRCVCTAPVGSTCPPRAREGSASRSLCNPGAQLGPPETVMRRPEPTAG